MLLIGGTGFLGYYLVKSILYLNDRLDLRRKISMTVFDNFMRGLPTWLSALRENRQRNLVRHDITHPLPESMDAFDFIIHAASIASPTFYRKFPIETMDANINGLRLALEYCLSSSRHQISLAGLSRPSPMKI